jgi:hypothetical protein
MPNRLTLADRAPHPRRSLKWPCDVAAGHQWSVDVILDLVKAACAALLFVAPWLFEFAAVPAWNLWIVAYLMLTSGLAKFVAEADWETQANCCLGAWVLSAPWILGFSSEGAATTIHVFGGGCVCILSAIELWGSQRNPPWRFGPGSALRAASLSTMITPPNPSARLRWTCRWRRPAARTGRRAAAPGSICRRRDLQLGKARARWTPQACSMSLPGGPSNTPRAMEARHVA